MSAAATAAQVLTWAAEPAGPVPVGTLWEAAALAAPPASVRAAAGQLARRTSARLGAGSPPFGGRGSIGPGAVFLAAAAGGRQQPAAAALLAGAVPAAVPSRDTGAWYDLVARHGVASPVIAALEEQAAGPAAGRGAVTADTPAGGGEPPEPLPELLLGASPLTAVLYRPPLRALRADATRPAVATAVALLSRPHGPAVLAAGLACWSPRSQVLAWRARLLAQLRHEHRDLLLDVYLAARTRFAADWDEKVSWAARQLSSFSPTADPLAVATLQFWAPLAAIERERPLSRLRPLMSGQDPALSLVRLFRLDLAGAA